jgi:hypothetical protein
MRTVLIVVVLLVLGSVGVLSVAPFPGRCDIRVSVGAVDIGVIVGTIFSISSVNPSVVGKSTIIDWQAVGLGFAPPALAAQFTMTVSLSDGQSVSKTENQFFPSVPLLNGQQFTASDTFYLGYVPVGNYAISVVLTQSGVGSVATGSGSISVGC